MGFNLKKEFRTTLGLDLRTSDLLREPGAATEVNNVMFRQTGALSKRKGYQIKTENETGGAGLHKFNNINIDTGVITEELITFDDDAHLYTQNTITFSYSGAGSAYYDMYYDTTNDAFFFDVYEDGASVSSTNLGNGKGGSDTTVAQLVTTLNALTDFTCTTSGSPSTPAAFIDLNRNVTVASGGTSVYFYTWVTIDPPNNYTTPFSSHWAARNDADFELNTVATINDVLFIANGYDELHKYDGNRVYRAGMKAGSAPTTNLITGSSSLTGSFNYKYLYEYTDAKGNIIQGVAAETATAAAPSSQDVELTVQFLQDTTGFNTDQAVADGSGSPQSGTTITVDSGHNLKVDDTVYISDNGSIVSRVITATTATTITVNAALTSVPDNSVISCVKVIIYRTKNAGTLYYELTELVNDSSSSTSVYTDTTADSSLLVDFVEPIRPHELPPKGRYIDVWRDTLIITGDRQNVNKVYYSDIDSAEYFPSLANNFTLAAKLGGGNSGLKVLDNTLFVFKPESILSINGDLAADNFRVDPMSDEGIGCIAHATIKEINRRVWFLSNKGVYSLSASDLRDESSAIDPRFDIDYNSKQSVAFHWIDRDMYILLLPILSTDGGSEDYYGSTSVILTYDKFRKSWLQWSNWNMQGGMAEYNDEIYLSGRELDPVAGTAKNYTKKVIEKGTLDDYMDHDTAITFTYKSHWEALQEPSVFKKFNRIKLQSLDGSINDFETQSFSLDITTDHDYVASAVSSLTLDMGGGASGWGNSEWGNFPWGETRLTSRESKLASKKAKALRVNFSNTNAQENVLISGYTLEIATPFDMAIKE